MWLDYGLVRGEGCYVDDMIVVVVLDGTESCCG